jgi:hypothetical protein
MDWKGSGLHCISDQRTVSDRELKDIDSERYHKTIDRLVKFKTENIRIYNFVAQNSGGPGHIAAQDDL